jgi:hypothetical protein
MSIPKKALIGAGLLVVLILLIPTAARFIYSSCATTRECYLASRGAARGETKLTQMRYGLMAQFAASEKLLAFPVPAENGSSSLVIFDRNERTIQRVSSDAESFFAPFLSSDQQRIVFARSHIGSDVRDVLSCQIATWLCRVVVSVQGTIFSPAEISPDSIVFASSPPRMIDGRPRYHQHEVVLARAGSALPITQIRAYEMSSIAVTESKIIFGVTRSSDGDEILSVARPDNELSGPLIPETLISAKHFPSLYSNTPPPLTTVSASQDGQLIAFKRAANGSSGFDYNLNVANTDKKIIGLVKVTGSSGLGISRAQFVKQNVLFNELFGDRYVIKSWDLETNTYEVIAEINGADLLSFKQIQLTMSRD